MDGVIPPVNRQDRGVKKHEMSLFLWYIVVVHFYNARLPILMPRSNRIDHNHRYVEEKGSTTKPENTHVMNAANVSTDRNTLIGISAQCIRKSGHLSVAYAGNDFLALIIYRSTLRYTARLVNMQMKCVVDCSLIKIALELLKACISFGNGWRL